MKITLEEKENELLIKTLSCMGDGVIVTDIKGDILYMNAVAEKLTGWSLDTAKQKSFDEIFNIVDAETYKNLESPIKRAILAKTSVGLKKGSTLILDDGTSRYISASCSPIKGVNGSIMGSVVVFRDISRIRKIEQELERERNNFKAVFETAQIGMLILNKAAQIKLANRYFLDIVNKDLTDVIDKAFGEGISCVRNFEKECAKFEKCGYHKAKNTVGRAAEEGCADCKIKEAIDRVVEEGVSIVDLAVQHTVMYDSRPKNIWFKFNLTPITISDEEQIVLTVEDITEQKENEKIFKKYQVLLENAQDIILFMDMDGKIVEANKAAVKAYGYTHEELLLLTIYDLRENSEITGEQLEIAYEKGLFFESIHTRKDGTTFLVEVSSKGAYIGERRILANIIRDATERKNAEMELKKAKEGAERANKSKSEFLANMSHEIRTPLNGMLGMIDLTLLTELSEEQKENLFTAKRCADSLLNIINDILDFSKMEAGKMVIEDINFDIKELIENIVRAHSNHAERKKLDLNYSLSTTIPTYLKGDSNRLQQILNNLINNAIKFTKTGEVLVSVIKNAEFNDNIELKFTVADTGIGISDKDKARLFKIFSQLDGSYTRKHKGTGLGLAISKQLVEMMGGKMWVESEKGKGSTFYFTLKFTIGDEPTGRQEYIPALAKSMNSRNILLVEDDRVNQIVLTKMLKEKGHDVTVANNGLEAVSMYKQGQYDIILMDIQMPIMDGIVATRQIRALEPIDSHIPIVALTAFALHGDREKFLSNGLDDYISKPVQMEELFYIIDVLSRTKEQPKFLFEGIPRVDSSGNVIFVEKAKGKSEEELMPIISQIEDEIELLKETLKYNDLLEIESIAHRIKNLSNEIDVEQLRNAAFKIELSTRRGSLGQTVKNIAHIMDEFDAYKKSIL